MISYLLTPLLATLALASPIEVRAAAGPSVTIKNGTVIGATSGGVDSFKGIPFAQPPVGQLRLKPPQPAGYFGTLNATGSPMSCPQQFVQGDNPALAGLPTDVAALVLQSPLGQSADNSGEDCLTMQIYRPANISSDAKLPVDFWIYGGGFEIGSSEAYDGTNLVTKSIQLGKPIIFMAVSYRLSAFGFLAGKELAADHSTNLGLRDQRLGLEWAAENIAAFGGDPNKVTIHGESAGSISVFDQTIINGGDNTYKGKPLFRGAIMNSGSTIPTNNVSDQAPQAVYDLVVKNAGCSSAKNTLDCLRSVNYTTFLAASNSAPGILSDRSLDLAYLPRPDAGDNFFSVSPDVPLTTGKYAKVPIIIGDQEDEGPLFSLVPSVNITTASQVIDYLTTYFPSIPNARTLVTGLMATYPDAPLTGQPDGSPFNTSSLNDITPEFKRLAAVLGDITFTLTRRAYLDAVSSTVKSWSYLNTYLYGTPILGTFHGADIMYIFGQDGLESSNITQSVQTYYISFINDLDPNSLNVVGNQQIAWPQYNYQAGQRNLLEFTQAGQNLLPDTFRNASFAYLVTQGRQLRV